MNLSFILMVIATKFRKTKFWAPKFVKTNWIVVFSFFGGLFGPQEIICLVPTTFWVDEGEYGHGRVG